MHKKIQLSSLAAALLLSSTAFAFGPQHIDTAVQLVDELHARAPELALDIEVMGIDIEVAPGRISAANIVTNNAEVSSRIEIDNVKELGSSSAKVSIKTDEGTLGASTTANAESETDGRGATANASASSNVDMAAVVAAVKSSVSSTAIGAMNTGDITVSAAQNSATGKFELNGSDTFSGEGSIGFAFGTNVDAFNVASNQGDVSSKIEISGVEAGRSHGFNFNQGAVLNGVDISSVAMGAVNTGNISVTTTGVNLVKTGGR